jgi:hypothetical protein
MVPIIDPEIDGSTTKIGEIICSIVSETSQFNAKKKVEEFATDQNLALVCENPFPIFDQLSFLQSGVFCFPNSNYISKNELCDMDYVLVVETVFDPGGYTELFYVATFGGAITMILSSTLAVDFAGKFIVIVFDPGGNHHLPSKSLTDVPTSEKKHENFITRS